MMKQEDKNYIPILEVGIWDCKLDTIDIPNLIKICYQTKKETPSNFRSNKNGGYQSTVESIINNPLYFPIISKLNNFIQNFEKNPNIRIQSIWVNISPKGAYNSAHVHTSDVHNFENISGVLYLQTPINSGNFIGYNPLHPSIQGIHITPKPGQLLLFSQYLLHSVEPNQSDEDRISIAFNFSK